LGTAARNNRIVLPTETIGLGSANSSISASTSENNAVSIYPNPTQQLLNVVLNQHSGSSTIELFDAFGKKVISEKTTSSSTKLDLSKLAKGVYLIRINNNNQLVHQSKIIKQ
jgi:hypothetical protein